LIISLAMIAASISVFSACTRGPGPGPSVESTSQGTLTNETHSIETGEIGSEESESVCSTAENDTDDVSEATESSSNTDESETDVSSKDSTTEETQETESNDASDTDSDETIESSDESEDQSHESETTESDNTEDTPESTETEDSGKDNTTDTEVTEDTSGTQETEETEETEGTDETEEKPGPADKSLEYRLDQASDTYVVVGIGDFGGLDVIIPNTYNGKRVSAIEDSAFIDTELSSISFGVNIDSIGAFAFGNQNDFTIYFAGSKSDWGKIARKDGWNDGLQSYRVKLGQATNNDWGIPIG